MRRRRRAGSAAYTAVAHHLAHAPLMKHGPHVLHRFEVETRHKVPPVMLDVNDAALQPTTRCIRRGALLLQLSSRLTLEVRARRCRVDPLHEVPAACHFECCSCLS